jgi:hypothetical protein
MRFSKHALALYLAARIRYARNQYGFTEESGWAQVEGKSKAINRAYGEYVADLNTMQEFDLDWPPVEEVQS